ncbi:hypothetical protein KCU62_g274, partial [Aureobasidium sp. EXF-3399]
LSSSRSSPVSFILGFLISNTPLRGSTARLQKRLFSLDPGKGNCASRKAKRGPGTRHLTGGPGRARRSMRSCSVGSQRGTSTRTHWDRKPCLWAESCDFFQLLYEFVGVMRSRLGLHAQPLLTQVCGAVKSYFLVLPVVVDEFKKHMTKAGNGLFCEGTRGPNFDLLVIEDFRCWTDLLLEILLLDRFHLEDEIMEKFQVLDDALHILHQVRVYASLKEYQAGDFALLFAAAKLHGIWRAETVFESELSLISCILDFIFSSVDSRLAILILKSCRDPLEEFVQDAGDGLVLGLRVLSAAMNNLSEILCLPLVLPVVVNNVSSLVLSCHLPSDVKHHSILDDDE